MFHKLNLYLTPKKAEYLKQLFQKTYLTDIKERYKIKNDDDLEELVDIIASSIGGLTNPTKLENTFQTVKHSDISHTTIKSYLDILQGYYIQSAFHLPSEEKREQEVRSLKSINDSFKKFVITEDLISRYQDNDGINYMNIYEFLLNEGNL